MSCVCVLTWPRLSLLLVTIIRTTRHAYIGYEFHVDPRFTLQSAPEQGSAEGIIRFSGKDDEVLAIEIGPPNKVWELALQTADELPVIAMRRARMDSTKNISLSFVHMRCGLSLLCVG